MVVRKILRHPSLRCLNLTTISPSLLAFMSEQRGYEDAVKALNTLQTNAQVLAQIRKERGRLRRDNLVEMRRFVERAGVSMEQLDELSVIHVSGTKGKGSTCAFTESILRNCGFKTGFYSSPHLIEVRERIRINGKPLAKNLFAKYFFKCWDNLQSSKTEENQKMPAYFRFLTLMAFYVFLHEQVDVAILEVGIGGAYDSTNIIRKPVVCGVTSLGMDHVQVLGGSLESIALHKAGIFKPNVPAFTVPQDESALQVVAEKASELQTSLHVVPSLDDYPGKRPELGIDGEHQGINASTAIQLSRTWIQKHEQRTNSNAETEASNEQNAEDDSETKAPKKPRLSIPVAETFEIPDSFREGLRNTRWWGRNQMIVLPKITFYIDGAHTPRSIEACIKWFLLRADDEREKTSGSTARVLLFNLTGDRDPHGILRPLIDCKFDHAVFSPNTVSLDSMGESTDLTNFTVTRDSQLRHCVENQRCWMALRGAGFQSHADEEDHLIQNGLDDGPYSTIFPCVAQALRWITAGRDPRIPTNGNNGIAVPETLTQATRLQVLVTGSLHLVGTALKVLGSDITGEM
ncbi:folylpolyglutamate synthase, mitochondrial [Nematostella vectensis]|uniref:folylpolyglutamate synthase, mitochondrial n=1 Tax=Nematostella vectensis TaxID=45351 RepID=UPI0020774EF3|nr:folylpolyglutamate synthase, mitochondrial [Nematostella vectensis]